MIFQSDDCKENDDKKPNTNTERSHQDMAAGLPSHPENVPPNLHLDFRMRSHLDDFVASIGEEFFHCCNLRGRKGER
jgi:hypothetical protein